MKKINYLVLGIILDLSAWGREFFEISACCQKCSLNLFSTLPKYYTPLEKIDLNSEYYI